MRYESDFKITDIEFYNLVRKYHRKINHKAIGVYFKPSESTFSKHFIRGGENWIFMG